MAKLISFATLLYGVLSQRRLLQHDGHQHTDDDIRDCECTSGYETSDLDSDCSSSSINEVESYLFTNECTQYCESHDMMGDVHLMYTGDDEDGFRCFQAYTLLVQYHDYCITGSVNESLLHHYFEVCPDCQQEHHYIEGADECDAALDCTDSTAQEDAVQFVSENCIESCDGNCTDLWKEVDGYHRMCAHGDLSEEFDTLYVSLSWDETVCNATEIHCNVPWEANYTANCSSEVNEEYTTMLSEYGDFTVDDDDSGVGQKGFVRGTLVMVVVNVLVVMGGVTV